MGRKSRKLNVKRIILFGVIAILVLYLIISLIIKFFFGVKANNVDMFIASSNLSVDLYNKEYKADGSIIRGNKLTVDLNNVLKDENGKEYYKTTYNNKEVYVLKSNLVDDLSKTVLEKEIYVRTSAVVYSNPESGSILGSSKKGTKLEITGFLNILPNGEVDMYKVKYNDQDGYIYRKYLVFTEEEALAKNEQYSSIHSERGDKYGAGDAGELDYYPVEKPNFDNNKMPTKVYALYLNGTKEVLSKVDQYIAFAKETKINAFVVDIKDNEAPRYASEIMKAYSKTNYDNASNSVSEYQSAISKLKDAGFYVIGRITVFKDKYYAEDNPDNAIGDTRTGKPFYYSKTYWPSPFNRAVWQFNVDLAKEAVSLMKFNEIQFDYVRFPDRATSYEKQGIMDFKNTYGESKAQAIQQFLMYACDELHKLNVYVSADVFGESAYNYVTAYGQYWPAISNVVDVISAMPYPDHFNQYEFGFKKSVWTMPYEILNHWGKNYAAVRQTEIPTPAVARTWIQAYNVIRDVDKINYNAKEVEAEIKGLFDATLSGGYMTWNSASSLDRYKIQKDAYSKEY